MERLVGAHGSAGQLLSAYSQSHVGAPTPHSWRSLCLALVAAAQGAEIPVGKWNPARDKSLMVALCGDSLAAAGHSFGYCERACGHSFNGRT